MTNPTGAADERERLAASLHDRCPHGCRCSLQQAADMLRADAETIRSLRTINEGQQREGHAAISRLETQLAAQSAELERAKKYLREIRRDPLQTRAFWREIDELTAAPSAAGGEKEG